MNDHTLSITATERDWSSCELIIENARYELRVYTSDDTIQVFLELVNYRNTKREKQLGKIKVPYETLRETA